MEHATQDSRAVPVLVLLRRGGRPQEIMELLLRGVGEGDPITIQIKVTMNIHIQIKNTHQNNNNNKTNIHIKCEYN